MTTVITSVKYSDGSSDSDLKTEKGESVPPLGQPFQDTKRYFWQKSKERDLDAIATQVYRPRDSFLGVTFHINFGDLAKRL